MTTATEIRITVLGEAQPAGSKRAFAMRYGDGRPVMRPNGTQVVNVIDDNSKSKDWKRHVTLAARRAYCGEPLEGPIEVEMIFYRVRPKNHFGSGKNASRLKDTAPAFPTGKPDVLKLARGVEDALTGWCYVDDSQIVDEYLAKRYGDSPRCEIVIRSLAVQT